MSLPSYVDLIAFDSDGRVLTDAANITGRVSVDGGAWADLTNTATHQGNGVYRITLTSGEQSGSSWSFDGVSSTSGVSVLPVSVNSEAGTATLAKQDEILGKFSTTTLLSQPVDPSGTISNPLIIGDDYKAANGRALAWTVSEVTGMTVGTATCKLGFSRAGKGAFTVSGIITDLGSSQWRLDFDIARTDSADLEAGLYDWSVEVAAGDAGANEVTRVRNSDECGRARWVEKQT